jgi:hypothetical protein
MINFEYSYRKTLSKPPEGSKKVLMRETLCAHLTYKEHVTLPNDYFDYSQRYISPLQLQNFLLLIPPTTFIPPRNV